MAETWYRVTAPVVICKAMTPDGVRWTHVQQGGRVPDEADAQWISGHLHEGMIVKVGGDPEPQAEVPPLEPPRMPSDTPKTSPQGEGRPRGRAPGGG